MLVINLAYIFVYLFFKKTRLTLFWYAATICILGVVLKQEKCYIEDHLIYQWNKSYCVWFSVQTFMTKFGNGTTSKLNIICQFIFQISSHPLSVSILPVTSLRVCVPENEEHIKSVTISTYFLHPFQSKTVRTIHDYIYVANVTADVSLLPPCWLSSVSPEGIISVLLHLLPRFTCNWFTWLPSAQLRLYCNLGLILFVELLNQISGTDLLYLWSNCIVDATPLNEATHNQIFWQLLRKKAMKVFSIRTKCEGLFIIAYHMHNVIYILY